MITDSQALADVKELAERLLAQFSLEDTTGQLVHEIANSFLGIVLHVQPVTDDGVEHYDLDHLERVRAARDEVWSKEAQASVRPVNPRKEEGTT